MLCPYCQTNETKVIDKRDHSDSTTTRRRRECSNCHKRFTTYERIEHLELEVEKKSGRTEQFSREKLRSSIARAVRKHVADEQISEIVDRIELQLSSSIGRKVTTSEIGSMVMDELTLLDKLSYLRFASVYKNFKSLDDFAKEIENLKLED